MFEENSSAEAESVGEEFLNENLNGFILQAADQLYRANGNQGYRAQSDFTNNIQFGDHLIKAHNPPYTMCVSFQFELLICAIILAEADSPMNIFKYLNTTQWFGLNGFTLQNCVWENKHCHSVGQALEIFGMGKRIGFEHLRPGSFISYDHQKGGHSVCFLHYLNAEGTVVGEYSREVAGFRFIASNGSRDHGDGISYRDGVLEGKDMKSSAYRQATGIRNMRCGAAFGIRKWSRGAPQSFIDTGRSTEFDGLAPEPPSGQE